MQPLPTISIRGRLVVVEDGPDVTTHTLGNHTDAIAFAADLEDAAKADRQRRADLLAQYVADGVDVVVPEGWDEAESVVPASDSEPVVVPDAVVTIPPPAAGPGIVAAPSDSVPPAAGPGMVPAASDSGSAGAESGPTTGGPPVVGPAPVTIRVDRYEASSQRQMITITATEPVKLHRTAGDKSAETEIPAGEVSRWFKAPPGAEWVFRLGAADGPIVASGVIPGG